MGGSSTTIYTPLTSDEASLDLIESSSSDDRRPGFNYNYYETRIPQSLHSNSNSNSNSSNNTITTTTMMIDNSKLCYLPLTLSCGVTVYCRPDVLARCPMILSDLDKDVRACLTILPRSVSFLIKRTPIWINTTFYYGPSHAPKNVNHSTAHHHEGWLLWANDRPDKAPGIEIYNCFDYRRMRWHWNGCGLLLHEFCHIIHQFCLGLDHPVIEEAYRKRESTQKYQSCLRRDWAGLEKDTDMAYALVNPKEFFAELSVAYWSTGYPHLEHNNNDATSMQESSPPFAASHVVMRLNRDKYPIMVPKRQKSLWILTTPSLPPHCNKFYPFTRRQFESMDLELFEIFDKLWNQIADWQDDEADCCRRRCCC